MMVYTVKEQLIVFNRSHKALHPQGFVIHSTDTPGAAASNEHDYFNSGDRQASAHYFTDWVEIIRTIPEAEQAWHAGPTANSRFLSVEMCEPATNTAQFNEVWNRTVWLVADTCVRYGWNTKDNVFSHRGISALYHETDHTDPIGFLTRCGKTWEQLLAAIDAGIAELKSAAKAKAVGPKPEEVKRKMKNLVIYRYPEDAWVAGYLADYLHCPLAQWEKQLDADTLTAVDNVFQVGGTAINSSVKLISGTTAVETARKVLELIK